MLGIRMPICSIIVSLSAMLLFTCEHAYAKTISSDGCPKIQEFNEWRANFSSHNALIRLNSSLRTPPLPATVQLSIPCVRTSFRLIPAEERGFFVADMSESKNVSQPALIAWLANLLFYPDDEVALQAAVGLSRLGSAATPTLLRQFLTPFSPKPSLLGHYSKGETSCNEVFRPWALASLALERIGSSSVDPIISFIASHVGVLAKRSTTSPTAPAAFMDLPRNTPLDYLLILLPRIDATALRKLFDALPDNTPDSLRHTIAASIFAASTAEVEPFLVDHPEYLSDYFLTASRNYVLSSEEHRHIQINDPKALLNAAHSPNEAASFGAIDALLALREDSSASAVSSLVAAKLKTLGSEQRRPYLALILKNDISWLDANQLSVPLKDLMSSGGAEDRISAWKGLADFRQASTGQLDSILDNAFNSIAEDPGHSESTFNSVSIVLGKVKQTFSPQSARVSLLADLAQCPTANKLMDTLKTLLTKHSSFGNKFGIAAEQYLSVCSKANRDTPLNFYLSETVTDSNAGDIFWNKITAEFPQPELIGLTLDLAPSLPPAESRSLYTGAMNALRDNIPDESIDGIAGNVAFIAFVRSRLVANPEEALAVLTKLAARQPGDLTLLRDRLLESSDQREIFTLIGALQEAGSEGRQTLFEIVDRGADYSSLEAAEYLAKAPTDLDVPMLNKSLNNPNKDVRLQIVIALLRLDSLESVSSVLRYHPEDIPGFISLVSKFAREEEAMNLFGTFSRIRRTAGSQSTESVLESFYVLVDDEPDLRVSLTNELADEVDSQSKNRAKREQLNWLMAAQVGGRARARLIQELDNGCQENRVDAFAALVKTAQNPKEYKEIVEWMIDGVPFVTQGATSGEPCDKSKQPSFARPSHKTNRNHGRVYSDFHLAGYEPSADELKLVLAQHGMEDRQTLLRLVEALSHHFDTEDLSSFDEVFISLIEELAKRDDPESAKLVQQEVELVLESACDACQTRIELLLMSTNWGRDAVLSLGVRKYSKSLANEYYQDFATMCSTLTAAVFNRLPDFQFPQPSDRTELDDRFVTKWKTLGDSFRDLRQGLASAGYTRYGLFAAPGGYALVTGLERTTTVGETLPDRQRWSFASEKVDSIGEYLATLFFGESGHYRMLTFVLSDSPLHVGNSRMEAAKANTQYLDGGTELPDDLASKAMQGVHCNVLIYEYERSPGDVHQVIPSSLPITVQLRQAGLTRTLQIPN